MSKPVTFTRFCAPLIAAALLAGCGGGSKLLKEPVPMVLNAPLTTERDARLAVAVDWVIVPGGPGSWAKNVHWDEYLLSVQPLIDRPIEVVAITVVDGLAVEVEPQLERKQLVAATKATHQRFRDAGLKPKPGANGDVMLAGTTMAAAGYGAFAGAQVMTAATFGLGGSTAATAGAAAGAIGLAAPVLLVGGIIRADNNREVNTEILERQTTLPITLSANEPSRLHVFMPITPDPQRVLIRYRCGETLRTLELSVATALDGLHLPEPKLGSTSAPSSDDAPPESN
ncbi:MAG: hypothetical protein AAFM91_16590 [Pseudomonadota bacterium]